MKLDSLFLLLGGLLAGQAFAQQPWPFFAPSTPNGYQPTIQAPQVQQLGQPRNPYLPEYVPAPPPVVGGRAPSASPNASNEGATLSDLGKSLRNTFTEEEIDLLFQYMKDSVIAAFKGEEVVLPPDLAFKLEVVLARMKRESAVYMEKLIQQLEDDLKRSLKEKLVAPPPQQERIRVTP
jgi:hypothetical protein